MPYYATSLFRILNAQNHNLRTLQGSDSTQKTISIVGVKEGDMLDLTSIISNSSNALITQNGTHMQMDLGNSNIFSAEIMLGSSFVNFNFVNGNITISNQNMTQVLADVGIFMVNGSIVFSNVTDSSSISESSSMSFSPGITPTSTPIPVSFAQGNVPTAPQSISLNTGAIIGIAVGGVVGLVLASIGIYAIWKACKTTSGQAALAAAVGGLQPAAESRSALQPGKDVAGASAPQQLEEGLEKAVAIAGDLATGAARIISDVLRDNEQPDGVAPHENIAAVVTEVVLDLVTEVVQQTSAVVLDVATALQPADQPVEAVYNIAADAVEAMGGMPANDLA